MERTKRVGELEEDLEKEAKRIFLDFKEFTTGTRYITLLHRTKDGGDNKEYRRRGGFYITHSPEEYMDALVRLLALQIVSSKPYRLYACVNARDMKKAERQLKIQLLENDFTSPENKEEYYRRFIPNWASSLMASTARKTKYFLLDVDGEGDVTAPVLKNLADIGIEPIKQYKTPHGWHIITDPFNPELLIAENCEIKKDSLLLLKA